MLSKTISDLAAESREQSLSQSISKGRIFHLKWSLYLVHKKLFSLSIDDENHPLLPWVTSAMKGRKYQHVLSTCGCVSTTEEEFT